ncbi:KpsF/GutQ family sugar-phosphate isomerase [Candidatus Marinimicrobia bacterium MT.SAG.3]|nr:KpsF/GutQ family sugar-phosphate isomerase [Candidatus Marinimicrobia bacterium MT.SAG.3]TFB12588.1 KpsF/GutQ family sugar-phosphate isomerase [Candidatus Marinimicrobia bacterium MT.SAG.4]
MTPELTIQKAKEVIRVEADAIAALSSRIDGNFVDAVELLFECKGRVIVTGVGKSGLVARKIAATLASTGTSAFFIHAAEGLHGDLGVVREEDVILIITKSGETSEISALIPQLRNIGVKLITITGTLDTSLTRVSDIVLDASVKEEACPHDLAPTASSTAALVMGDALAVALLERRGFTMEDFASIHPGGNLGKKLLTRIEDLMYTGDHLPIMQEDSLFKDVILEMNRKRFGAVCIVDDKGKLKGIITEGDLRREIEKGEAILQSKASESMSTEPKVVSVQTLAVDALALLEEFNILQLIMVDEDGKPIGMIHLHDLLDAGIK